ncbi:MAG: riboflavin synthase [Chloroflexi bacterium]|nr:riboflavin synthase [Chloroflexota bacterium]
MFTGIVEELGALLERRGSTLVIGASRCLHGLKNGDSIAVNGACLTVTGLSRDSFTVDITPETEARTNLGLLKASEGVNLERALSYGQAVGGHLVQGHVDGRGRVLAIRPQGNSLLFRFRAPARLMRYIVEKGFIAVDGISLTVVRRYDASFTVSVIPYTRENTNLGRRSQGDVVNLEVDVLAKYVERLISPWTSRQAPGPS